MSYLSIRYLSKMDATAVQSYKDLWGNYLPSILHWNHWKIWKECTWLVLCKLRVFIWFFFIQNPRWPPLQEVVWIDSYGKGNIWFFSETTNLTEPIPYMNNQVNLLLHKVIVIYIIFFCIIMIIKSYLLWYWKENWKTHVDLSIKSFTNDPMQL